MDLKNIYTTVMKPAREVFKLPKYEKASDVLVAAKKILSHEERWISDYLARAQEVTYEEDSESKIEEIDTRKCSTKSKEATAFCALGAVQFVNGPMERSATAFLREAAALLNEGVVEKNGLLYKVSEDADGDAKIISKRATTGKSLSNDAIFDVNDNDDFKERERYKRVLAMFTMAIKRARKAEKAEAKNESTHAKVPAVPQAQS